MLQIKKKQKLKETISKLTMVAKKKSEAERKKSEQRKMNKRNQPKGIRAKRLGMITFWLLFGFMFLVTLVNVFSSSDVSSQNEAQMEKNKLYDNEGLEFAKEFVYQYFTWQTDQFGKDRRIHNLKPYFLSGIDEMGGIIYDDTWSSSIDKRDIVLKDVQKISDSQARYIFKVKFTLKAKTDAKNTPTPEFHNFDEVLKDEKKIKVINGYKVKVNEKYISVPVYYNKEKDRFAIFDLPSFTYVKEDSLDEEYENQLEKLDVVSDVYVEQNVTAFLNTFFEAYTRDGRDKLNYILEDERHQDGLGGTMQFIKIQESKLYNADKNNNKFIADVLVVLRDSGTNFEFVNKYLLVIKRADQRYVVESLNDEKAVNKLIKKYLKEIESEDALNKTETEPEKESEENQDFNYQEAVESNESELEEMIEGER